VAIYLAYVAGLTLIVGVLAIAAATASSALADRMRRILPLVNRISGALLVLVGLYVGYYGLYEVRLFSPGAHVDPQDAVITAAGRLQGALAAWVHQHGAWPWAVALVVLVALCLCWTRARRSTVQDASTHLIPEHRRRHLSSLRRGSADAPDRRLK
jgi:hypothetical protein